MLATWQISTQSRTKHPGSPSPWTRTCTWLLSTSLSTWVRISMCILITTKFWFSEKAFDITYVRLKFSSPRPESFAIYKKIRNEPWKPDPDPENGWIPWQYYSASCMDTYRVPESLSIIQPIYEGDTQYAQKVGEDRALCTSEFSDISPLSGGNVAFATLDGRPGAYNFDHNRELQYWVSATDIRY